MSCNKSCEVMSCDEPRMAILEKRPDTRPYTRLPKSRAGGQGPYLRSLDHLGWSSEAKDHKNQKSKE